MAPNISASVSIFLNICTALVEMALYDLGKKTDKIKDMQRVSVKRSFRNSVLITTFGFVGIFLFQNCAETSESGMITVDSIEENYSLNAPFAYDVKVDRIAYMSCSGAPAAGASSLFTFKAGGYNPGSGVGLRDSYKSYISVLNSDARVRSFALSERNQEAIVLMSLRQRNNLQFYMDPTGENGEIPQATMMFNKSYLTHLSSEDVAKKLVALGSGSYLNYLGGFPGLAESKSFDGEIRLSISQSFEEQVRSDLKNSFYLTFTFAHPLQDQTDTDAEQEEFYIVRSPYNALEDTTASKTSVFGLGYDINFQQFDALMSSSPARAMRIQSAVNLEDSSILAENWNCSERFVVVRPEDADRLSFDTTPSNPDDDPQELVCDTKADVPPSTYADQERWNRIRSILPVEDWWVNLPQEDISSESGTVVPKPGCIIPKSGIDRCYDMDELNANDNENIKIAYYYGEDLDDSDLGITYDGKCGEGTMFICPHIVTICYKE